MFLGLSGVVYGAYVHGLALSVALGLIRCIAVILLVVTYEEKSEKIMDFLAKYTIIYRTSVRGKAVDKSFGSNVYI